MTALTSDRLPLDPPVGMGSTLDVRVAAQEKESPWAAVLSAAMETNMARGNIKEGGKTVLMQPIHKKQRLFRGERAFRYSA